MDPEDKKIIRENLEIAEDNQKMLKKIRRSMLLGNFTRVIYWVIIIGASLGAYYYIQPYIDSARDSFNQFQKGVNTVSTGADVVSDGVVTTTEYTGDVIDSVLDFGKGFLGE